MRRRAGRVLAQPLQRQPAMRRRGDGRRLGTVPAAARPARAGRPRPRSPARPGRARPAPPPAGPGAAGTPAGDRRTCRSYPPEVTNSASVSWSSTPVCRSARSLAATTPSTRCAGSTSQASRSAGRERLARGPGVHDPVRRERLQRADRVPVVPELAVVVVLDTSAPVVAPRAGPPLGRQHAAERELVRRGQQQRVGRRSPARRRARPPARSQRAARAAATSSPVAGWHLGLGRQRAAPRRPVPPRRAARAPG